VKIMNLLLIVLFSGCLVYGEIVTIHYTGHFTSSSFSGYITSANDYIAGDTIEGEIVYDTQAFIRTELSNLPVSRSIHLTSTDAAEFNLSIYRNDVEIANMATLFPSFSYEIQSETSFMGSSSFDPVFFDSSESFSFRIIEELDSYPDWKSTLNLGFYNFLFSLTEIPMLSEPQQILNPNDFAEMSLSISDVQKPGPNTSNGGEFYSFSIDNISVVPEPLTLTFLGLGAILVRRKSKS